MRASILLLLFMLCGLCALYAQDLKLVKDSVGNYGYKSRNGNLVIPYKYRNANEFSEGLAAVWENGEYGFIDVNDKLVIPYRYSSVLSNFSEGLVAVNLDGKWGYIDKKGNQVTPFLYDFTYGFDEGLAAVKMEDKWGFIDRTGKLVIPCIYASVFSFREGLVAVKLNDKWGYLNKTGKEVIPFLYDDAGSFHEGFAAVQAVKEKGFGYINSKGEMVIPAQFKNAYSFDDNGLAMVITATKGSAYINQNGKTIDVNNQTNGTGKYRFRTGEVYDGQIVNGQRTGKGKNVWVNGDVYEGNWVNNTMTGKGKKILANGNVYEGDWNENMLNGKGRYKWADGAVYEGDWVNGTMTGKGKLTWANGNKYNGDFKENDLHGKGIFTKANGEVKNGDWVNGNFTGSIKQTNSSTAKLSGAEVAAQKALDFRNAGNYAAALLQAQTALKLDANNFLALFARALLYAEYEKNGAKAIAFYSKAILVNGNDFRPFLFRASALIDTNRLPEAQTDLSTAINLNAKCFDCFALRSYVLGKEQKWEEARDQAKLALDLKPGSEEAKFNYEMYKGFAEPLTIDATSYAKKEEPVRATTRRIVSPRFTSSEYIDLSDIKRVNTYDEVEYKKPVYGKRTRTNLSQSDMNNIIKSNSPSSSSGESGWDSWFRDRDRQSNRDYKIKNGTYRGY